MHGLRNIIEPTVVAGDFNSQLTLRGYNNNDPTGDTVVSWMDQANTFLIYDFKQIDAFSSARRKKDNSPDLRFISLDKQMRPQFQREPQSFTRFPTQPTSTDYYKCWL